MSKISIKKKSVIIVSNCTWYLFNFRNELLNDLKNKDYNLILVSPSDKYISEISKYFNHIENLFLKRSSENPLIEFITLINLLFIYKKYNPDLVHHFTIKPCFYGGIAARVLNIKNTINHITGLGPSFYSSRIKTRFLNKLLIPFYKYAFNSKKNNLINIFHNYSDRNTFVNKKITHKKRTKIIKGSGVNIDFFKNNSYKKDSNHQTQILFPARIIKEKGIIELIYACEELWKENYNFILNIAGEVDKQNKSHLNKDTINFFYRNKKIRFLGKCENMKDIYQKMDLVVLPSWREGLSKSLLEAASMSLPIITTNVPGCMEIIKNKYSGYVVQSKNKEKLKKAIKNFMENPKIGEAYGQNARKTVSDNFTVSKINTKILNIYNQFLNIR